MRLSSVIITFNEEKNIEECIHSVQFCDEIIVVDSGSKDKTTELSSKLGAKVYQNNFVDYASQKNFAIGKAGGQWLLLIDADERVSDELKKEILTVISENRVNGYYLKRHNQIFGKWMNYGANANDYQLRLLKKGFGLFKGKIHERIELNGKALRLRHPLLHRSTATIKQYMYKLNHYTHLEVAEICNKKPNPSDDFSGIKPILIFLHRYIIQLGFLDGREGLIFNVLSGYYDFVRKAKCWERYHS